MNWNNIHISETYNLGGSNKYVIGVKRGNQQFFYGFVSPNKSEIVNFIAKMYNSRAYLAKSQGIERVFLLSAQDLFVYFVK